jgi:hypothetical protein
VTRDEASTLDTEAPQETALVSGVWGVCP